jgi:hypothetical protein
MSLFKRIAGLANTFFQLGGPSGPALKSNSGAIEHRNAGDSAFAVARGATPVADNDLTTKAYVDQAMKPIPVGLQFNGGSSLPSNSGTEQYYVVTTSGVNATIGQLLWDDGSSSGTVAVIAATTGNTIVTTAALSGGTVTFNSNAMYTWTGSAWIQIGATVSGGVLEIDMAVGTGASQSSATSIPANAVISSCELKVTTPFSGGTTISVGQTGSASLLMATGDNTATVANEYQADQRTDWGGSSLPVLVTVAGSPSAGAARLNVQYSLPNA